MVFDPVPVVHNRVQIAVWALLGSDDVIMVLCVGCPQEVTVTSLPITGSHKVGRMASLSNVARHLRV